MSAKVGKKTAVYRPLSTGYLPAISRSNASGDNMTSSTDDTIFLPNWQNRYHFEKLRMGEHIAIDPTHCCCSISKARSRIYKRGIEIGKMFVFRANKKTGLLYVRRIA
jgi:hypothetical protein